MTLDQTDERARVEALRALPALLLRLTDALERTVDALERIADHLDRDEADRPPA
jgi:hypothetical protein